MSWNEFTDSNYLNYLILFTASFAVAFLASFILRKLISVFNRKYSKRLNVNTTNLSFLKNSISFILYTAAAIFVFYHIPSLRTLGTALFAGAGIAAVVIGFAAQKAFSNIISGIFILMFKPFSVGDTIKIGERFAGIVEEITLRHIIIRDYEHRRIIIPNSIISDETIINSTILDQKTKQFIHFGISYDSDTDKAIKIIREEAENHPYYIDNRTAQEIEEKAPKVVIRMISWDESSVTLRAYVWTESSDKGFVLKCDLLQSVKKRFEESGIEIPFPHRTIVYKDKNDLK